MKHPIKSLSLALLIGFSSVGVAVGATADQATEAQQQPPAAVGAVAYLCRGVRAHQGRLRGAGW